MGRGELVDCRYVTDKALAECYLNGKLEAPLQDEFEVHLLECPNCLQAIETLKELHSAVALEAARIRLAPERKTSRFWYWSFATASLLLLVALGVLHWRKPGPQIAHNETSPATQNVVPQPAEQQPTLLPAPTTSPKLADPKRKAALAAELNKPNTQAHSELSPAPETESEVQTPLVAVLTKPPQVPAAQTKPRELSPAEANELYKLAQVRPAPYVFAGLSTGTRSSKGMSAVENTASYAASSAFQDAMIAYVEKRYRDASEKLENAAQLEPTAPHINFYLGVCRLLLGRPDEAVPVLNQVVDEKKSRYVQAAHLYLAKAYLQKADLKQAEAELQAASAITGELKAEAGSLLERVRALRTARQGSPKSPAE